MTLPHSSTDRLLDIYLALGQYPILAGRIRTLMRRELFEQGFINPEVFEPEVIGISSVGPGLRVAYGSSVTLRFDYGFQIQRGEPPSSFTSRANFSLVWVF